MSTGKSWVGKSWIGKSWIGTSWVASLVTGAAVSLSPSAARAGTTPTGTILITVARTDDKLAPGLEFYAELAVDLEIAGSPPVVAAELVIVQDLIPGDPIPLEAEDDPENPDQWFAENEWTDFATLKADLDGTWILTLTEDLGGMGTREVISEFVVDTDTLTDGDFYQSPTITNPTHREFGVDGDTTLTWIAPAGGSQAYALVVEVENSTYLDENDETGDRDDNNIPPDGGMSITDTTWEPTDGLLSGFNDFAVSYFDDGRDFIGDVSVTQGSITWLPSPYAPGDYPVTPLLALGAESIIGFSVPVVEDFQSYDLQVDNIGNSIPDGEGGSVQVYFVRDTAPMNRAQVASVSQVLANTAAITLEPGPFGQLSWSLQSGSGQTETTPIQDGLVLVGDLPAFSDQITGGPFSDFFGDDPTDRQPKNMWDSLINISAREVTGAQSTTYRMLMTDSMGNQQATDEYPLSTAFQQGVIPADAFIHQLDQGFDIMQVVGLSVALFTTPGPSTPALEMRIDDVSVEFVPEPGAWQLGLAAFAALGVVARGRRKTS